MSTITFSNDAMTMYGEKFECADCGQDWSADDLNPLADFEQRCVPGEEIPAGECPECGAAAYVLKEK